MAAGFRSPLFILGLSGIGAQAGFIGPIPIVNLGGTPDIVQAGYIGPIPIINLGAGQAIVADEQEAGGYSEFYDRISREDEEILILITAFLNCQ